VSRWWTTGEQRWPCRWPAIAISRRALACLAVATLALTAAPALAVDREKGVKGAHVEGVPDFVDVQPIILPVIERNSVTRQVGIVVTLELADGEHADAVEPKRRQLTDAFIRELHTIYAWRSSSDRVVDEQLIKRRLLLVADAVLGQGVVHAILVRQLLEQGR
jgi:flagellar FliL protein